MPFIRAANPIWWLPDLVGLPLNDEYYMSTLINKFPYLPQFIFQDVNGTIPWSDPIQFLPNGTLPDNMYWNDSLVYRLEVRHGPNQSDPLIYEVNNFQPGAGSITPQSLDILSADNQITNSQFAEIDFVSPLVINVAGTYDIAPGWELVLTGSGTMTVTQLDLSGNDFSFSGAFVSAPFALRFASSGWTEAFLRQRFNNNGSIFMFGAVAATFMAEALNSNQTVTLSYAQSDSGFSGPILTASVTTGNFQVFSNAVNIPAPPFNTDTSDVAYTDIIITVPTNGTMDLTNIQVVGQTEPLPTNFDPLTQTPNYNQETVERNIDHQFHIFKDSLLTQAKTNLLTGWTFAINPWQFITTSQTTVSNQTQYIADQTILHQETNSSLSSGKGGGGIDFGLQIFAVGAGSQVPNRFALIQYIDKETIRPYWGQIVSSLVRSAIFTSFSTNVSIKMRLIYRASAPPTISSVEPILAWPTGQDPQFAAGWTAIDPLNDPAYLLTKFATGATQDELPSYAFNQFKLPNAVSATDYLGIVIYTTGDINNNVGTPDGIAFDRVSLVPNDFAIDAQVETFDEALRRCEFYYEKSYNNGVLPGTADVNGTQAISLPVVTDGSSVACYPKTIFLNFKQTKRTQPTITFYTPAGTAANVQSTVVNFDATVVVGPANVPITQWTAVSASADSALYLVNNTNVAIFSTAGAQITYEGILKYQYVADSRLGV